ncbi:MAG: hypothetical protein KDD37_08845 [Bdellovibrionales bacterium]|nr:hypothetical protein [Bdellovibrionales bacterium]
MLRLSILAILLSLTACSYPPLSESERLVVTNNFKEKLVELLNGKEGFEEIKSLEILNAVEKDAKIEVTYQLTYTTKDETTGHVQNALESQATLERKVSWYEFIFGPIFGFGGKTWTATTISPQQQQLDYYDPLEIIIDK